LDHPVLNDLGPDTAQPIHVAVASTAEADRREVESALSDTGLFAECQRITTLQALRALHASDAIDLIFLWPERSPVADGSLREMLAELALPPALLLAVDRIDAQAYVRAGALHAEDVVTTRSPGHLSFAMRRSLHTQALRHQLARAHKRLAENQVVARSTVTETPAPNTIPPLVEVIDDALRNDRLHLVFQPILAVNGDDVESYEVYVRLDHEDRDVRPEDFLPLAARYGLLPALDRWVVRHAVARFMDEKPSNRDSGAGLRFFLNVSAHTLVEERAAESLLKIIARARPRSGEFVIKLDKNTLLSRLAPAKTLNRLVKQVGLQFALDHYEHGDRHLNFMDHIAVDYVKLPSATTHGIDRDPRKRGHVLDIIATAHDREIRVIAGQVERATDLATLFHLGVDYAQGFQVAAPERHLVSVGKPE
jgi:EAL domain-containing protein (putative c-di-GMP-specific phosphodiesterase class I)